MGKNTSCQKEGCLISNFLNDYHPQTKFAERQYFYMCLSLYPQGGAAGTPYLAGTHPRQVHPQVGTPPWAGTSPGQVHPLGRYTSWAGITPLLGRYTPLACTPPWTGTPAPGQVHCQGRYTTPGRRSTSGRYASYWNAILFIQNCKHTWIVPAASRVYLASPGPIDAVTAPGNASCATRC